MSKKIAEAKIEKGIPVPKSRNRGVTDLMHKMQVGDSILLQYGTSVFSTAKYLGITITQRKVGDKVRIWRIK